MHSNGGGGGERVLWMIVKTLLSRPQFKDKVEIVIYSGDLGISPQDSIKNVKVFAGRIILLESPFNASLGKICN